MNTEPVPSIHEKREENPLSPFHLAIDWENYTSLGNRFYPNPYFIPRQTLFFIHYTF